MVRKAEPQARTLPNSHLLRGRAIPLHSEQALLRRKLEHVRQCSTLVCALRLLSRFFWTSQSWLDGYCGILGRFSLGFTNSGCRQAVYPHSFALPGWTARGHSFWLAAVLPCPPSSNCDQHGFLDGQHAIKGIKGVGFILKQSCMLNEATLKSSIEQFKYWSQVSIDRSTRFHGTTTQTNRPIMSNPLTDKLSKGVKLLQTPTTGLRVVML